MKSPEEFENRLKTAIRAEADKIAPSEALFLQIDQKIKEKNMEANHMNIKITRGLLIACLVVVLTTAACFAAVKIVSYTSQSTNNTFTAFPSEKEVKKEAGFLPKYAKDLTGGYVFYRGGVGTETGEAEDGSEAFTAKTATFSYKKGDSTVSLLVADAVSPDSGEGGEALKITPEIEGKYYSSMYKFVPEDYVMTDEDKADEASGKYIFSYGSDEVEINHIQQMTWEENGMSYTLINSDGALDKTTLTDMAAQIINQ